MIKGIPNSVLVLMGSFILSSCLGGNHIKQTRYYNLLQETDRLTEAQSKQVTLGIGPIQLPPYLDRPQMIRRTSANKVLIFETHRWEIPLDESISKVIQSDFAKLTPANHFIDFPWYRSTPVKWQLILTINRFDADITGKCILEADWKLLDARRNTIASGAELLEKQIKKLDQEKVVAAMRKLLWQLNQKIVASSNISKTGLPRALADSK